MATGAVYHDADGVERFQPAEVVILACNGVGTPRLLLNSASARYPNGLANSSGLVGRNLMFHPYASIVGIFDEPLDGYRGPLNCLWSQEFYETDRSRIRAWLHLQISRPGPITTAMTGMATGGPLGKATTGRIAASSIASRHGAICEDLPEAHNTVRSTPC
jgi:choline dehydrogenase-like flavoprotein